MTFKKDYINYLLYSVINSPNYKFYENFKLKKLLDVVTSIDDVMKLTYIIGKTSGLEPLFKYLLYISDKIDKAQVSVFNLIDNFEYDKQNIILICKNIEQFKSDSIQNFMNEFDEINNSQNEINSQDSQNVLSQDVLINEINNDSSEELEIQNASEFTSPQDINQESIDLNINNEDECEESIEIEKVFENNSSLELIQNQNDNSSENEVFELNSISELIENSDNLPDSNESKNIESLELDTLESETEKPDYNELDIEIKIHSSIAQDEEQLREESLTNEAYYKFENKFFEDVKILEKLLSLVSKDCINSNTSKLNDKCIQSLSEISGITSELANLSRQLSFDLIADIFFTMNMYITKSITMPFLLNVERIKLFDSSLALVNSLIKGEDYLNYDYLVDKMEKLKNEIFKSEQEQHVELTNTNIQPPISDSKNEQINQEDNIQENITYNLNVNQNYPHEVNHSKVSSTVFKLKYLVKEFEKSFQSISNLQGEFKKYEALDKISELNNALKHIAKLSSSIKFNDVLKLSEVTYVFLKYVKDYRMDMLETEIQQIVKYIIFSFKMLLTNKKPEDFNTLVQHLNNPDKIFADS